MIAEAKSRNRSHTPLHERNYSSSDSVARYTGETIQTGLRVKISANDSDRVGEHGWRGEGRGEDGVIEIVVKSTAMVVGIAKSHVIICLQG